MQLYRVWCRFERELGAQKGIWRVVDCSGDMPATGKRRLVHYPSFYIDCVGLDSTKPYPIGSIIRPHKELNRVIAARKGKENGFCAAMDEESTSPK